MRFFFGGKEARLRIYYYCYWDKCSYESGENRVESMGKRVLEMTREKMSASLFSVSRDILQMEWGVTRTFLKENQIFYR